LEWKVGVCGAKTTDKVILESLNCAFSGVDAKIVWLDELDRAILLLHECLDGRGSLIVGDIEDGFIPLVR
jgi:hypothetical protein